MNNFYLLATDGLCNRMRTIDSAITLAGKLNRSLHVLWVRNALLNSSFSKLFNSIDVMTVIESSNQVVPGVKFNWYPKNNPASTGSVKNLINRGIWKFHQINWNIKGSLFYDELLEISNRRFDTNTAESEKDSYELIFTRIKDTLHENHSNYIASCWRLFPDNEFYSHFKPVPELQDKIDTITSSFSNTIGLHIRRTDHREAIAHSGIDKFVALIERHVGTDAQATFFLATDDAETEAYLKNKFGARIITRKKSSYARNNEKGIQDAVVDLYCLSRTKKIYGSFRSSFSQVAGDISRIPVETVQ
jgi:hypothetical protein